MEKLLAMWVVSPRDKVDKIISTFKLNNSNLQYTMYGKGTVSQELADTLGLDEETRAITVGVIKQSQEKNIYHHLEHKLRLDQEGHGIIFCLNITSVVGTYSYRFLANDVGSDKMEENKPSKKVENLQLQHDFELVVVIVNTDATEKTIEAAKLAGARGGTIINAHGTGTAEANLLFGIRIVPEKAVVFFVVESKKKDAIMQTIAKEVGLSKPGQGIIFSQPVASAYGLVVSEEE